MSVGVLLRTEILAIPDLGTDRVSQNTLPQVDDLPYVYYERQSEESPICLDGTPQIIRSTFNIECLSESIDQAIEMADKIRAALNGRFGDFGGGKIRGCQVQNKDDDFIPRNDTDEGVHQSALTILIMQ